MSQISQKSISGITSITTPAGVDNQITIHTNNTSEALKLDHAGNIHIHNHVNTTGISSASNFKTGSSNLHSSGLSAASIDVGNNIKLGNAGVITATSFVGDGSDLTNLPAGLGTAISATATSPLNKMYYTNQVLGVPSSITVDVPTSASKAYTQYADIKVESSADLIIAEGDDLIHDVLGLADFGTFGGGASAGRIRVNSISNAANDGSPTVQKGLVVTGVTTSTTFSGSGASLTNLNGSNIASGTVPVARIGTGTKNTSTFYRGDGTFATVTSTTINNNGDNRVITGSGTANTLEGESNLFFNGSQLGVNVTPDSGVHLHVQNSGEANMILEGDVNGIGGYLMLKNNNTTANTSMAIQFLDGGGQGTSEIKGIYADNSNNEGHLAFSTRPSGGSMAERLRIESGGNIVLKRGGISATPSVKIFGSGNASDTAADDFTIHNWGDTDGDYWRLGVNCGMDANGNDSKPSNTLKGAGITIDGRYGRVFLKTSPSSSSTVYDTLVADSAGRVSKPYTPFVMVTINTTTNRQTTGSKLIIPWDTIHGRGTSSNVGSHFNTSNHRFTAPIAGRYMFICSMNIRGDNICYHRINGNEVSYAEYRLTEMVWDHVDFSFVYDMNANDYYEMYSQLYNGSGHRWNGGNTANGGWDTLSIYHLG